MTHVILDTNIWLYIANNFIGDYKGEGHLKLFKQLKLYQHLGYITIYVNDIIINEWYRNQSVQKQYIEKLKNKLKSKSELIAIENLIGNTEALDIVKKEFSNKIDLLILENENHIKNVEDFILNCINIPVNENHKLKTIDLAIQKKPPFHQNKNYVNDTLIMLSFDSYISNLLLTPFDMTYLVSNNKEDYCEDKKGNNYHTEIKKILSSNILYGDYNELWKILDLSEDLQKELNEEMKSWEEESDDEEDYHYFECKNCSPYGYNWGELDNSMKLVFASEFISKYQLSLFDDEEYKFKANTKEHSFWGTCDICHLDYFACPICDEYLNLEYEYCHECGTQFKLKKDKNSFILYVNDVK